MRRLILIGVVVVCASATLVGCSSSSDDVSTGGSGSTATTAAPKTTKAGAGVTKQPPRAATPACSAVYKYLWAIQSAGKAVRTGQEKTKAADELKTTGAAVASSVPDLGGAVLAINSALAVSLASTETTIKGGTTAPAPEAWSKALNDLKTYNREQCAAEE